MGKIVGNVFKMMYVLQLILLLSVYNLVADISLRVLDIDRSPLVQAGAGRPFLVEVTMHDVRTIGQPPIVQGLDNFTVKNAGVHITTINSKVTAKYTLEVRIDKPGTYTIGPAIFADRTQQESSPSIKVVVGNEQIESKAKKVKKDDVPILLRLSADKERIFVGERVHCLLRFYYTDPAIALQRFIEHDTNDIHRKKMIGPRTGTEKIQDIEYNYVEWECDVFPQKTGRCTIPAYGADYEQEIEERDNFWGGLGRFLGNHVVTKRVYSNAISLEVDPLPTTSKTPQAIGTFYAMNLSAKPAVAKQGEGIVVTVEIVGEGDLESLSFGTLENMPPALRFYASNQTVIEPTAAGEPTKKRYEFIVQGLQVGTWEIPPQSLYYFDTKQRAFTTVRTMPLSLTIMPSAKKMASITHEEQDNTQEAYEIAPLHKEWVANTVPDWRLSWWLFIMIACTPMMYIVYGFIERLFVRNRTESYGARRAQKAFSIAKEQLQQIKKQEKAQELYTLFITLFADRWQLAIAAISLAHVHERLRERGMSDIQCAAWDDFFARIAERAFGIQKGKDDAHLFDKAEQWIQQLEQLL